MQLHQRTIQIPAKPRGCHLITRYINAALSEMPKVEAGLLHAFIQHTSASLTVNENADPDVRQDMETALNHLVPEDLPFVHTAEGADDMPAHVKGSLMGFSVTIPVTKGQLALGTWQGLYLNEHRNQGGSRSIVLTLQGV